MNRIALLLAGLSALTTLAHCSRDGAISTPEPEATAAPAAAGSRLAAIRARFPNALEPTEITALATTDDGARPVLHPDLAHARTATVALPASAAGAVRLVDDRSGLAVAFALAGATDAPLAADGGLALYAHAAPGGGDVIHRPSASGVEDFVLFDRKPAKSSLAYHVDVTAVAGLRLVANTLEFLDEGGAPRLRVTPPYVIDAAGARADASLAIEGCAVDTSPRAPWGRAITRPGAATCTVTVSWDDAALRYPTLVDPSWVTTGQLATERSRHAITPLPNPQSPPNDASRLLITGGFDKNGTALKTAEIYEPLSRTFGITGSMNVGRAAHTSTSLSTSPSGHVLIAGGATQAPLAGASPETLPGGPLDTTEVYDPTSGTFTNGPKLAEPRFHHSATALNDGRVLIAGGVKDVVKQPSDKASIFTFDANDPGLGTITPVANAMTDARAGHAAVALANGDVLITGGIGSASFAVLSAEIFCTTCAGGAKDTFTAITPAVGAIGQLNVPRAFHTATLLPDGDVLIAGGINSTKTPIVHWDTVERYSEAPPKGFQTDIVQMSSARAYHTATRLQPPMQIDINGKVVTADVLLAGGYNGQFDVATVDAYLSGTDEVVSLVGLAMKSSRRFAAASVVNAGDSVIAGRGVIVTGGMTGATTLRSAELFLKPLGEPCEASTECLSGFCVADEFKNKVCCDTKCDGECFACSAAAKQSGDGQGLCGPAKDTRVLPPHCVSGQAGAAVHDFVVQNKCDGNGQAEQATAIDCFPNTCGDDGLTCKTNCVTTADCSATGWCNVVGDVGTCAPKGGLGASCSADEQCLAVDPDKPNGQCVDGVCCDLSCTGQCQACDLPASKGKCVTIGAPNDHVAPHLGAPGGPTRADCDGSGECKGYCDGAKADACSYPGADTFEASPACGCVDDACASYITKWTQCDGKGTAEPKDNACGGYVCAADAKDCLTKCTGNADCLEDYRCVNDACELLPNAGLCDGDHTIRVPGQADIDCAPYRCDTATNACATRCTSVDDCVGPTVNGESVAYVCSLDNVCVEASTIPAPTVAFCSFRAPAAGDEPAPWFLAASALAAGVLIRRRRR